ncbi:1-phosphofructokinase family hexose kinase [Aliiroseovarius sp. S253]|uniref:1-phosphofructokinase family hexose kinase n=1 Tax=Aliiroseovarius sp. S253 TaxID=3415133 RepID=UPI003C7C0598
MTDQQSDILTITLNPALDMSTSVDAVRREEKLRCEAPVLDPGGGGINVARAIRQIGGRAEAFVALAGFRGQQLSALLYQEQVPHRIFQMEGEIRLSFVVKDRSDDSQLRFVMPGPVWTPACISELCQQLEGTAMPGMHLVLSGSQPPGFPASFPSDLADLARRKGALVTLDTSGPALFSLLEDKTTAPDVLRLDAQESEALAGQPLPSIRDAAQFAKALVAQGTAKCVVLARGADGSVMAADDKVLHAKTPLVPVQSKIGAGDSFVGAFTLSRARGEDWKDALIWGVAAASAAVMTPATDLCHLEDTLQLRPDVAITEI